MFCNCTIFFFASYVSNSSYEECVVIEKKGGGGKYLFSSFFPFPSKSRYIYIYIIIRKGIISILNVEQLNQIFPSPVIINR